MRVALSSLGLILSFTGVIIGIVVIANPKPFYAPYFGHLVLLFSSIIFIYSIWSLYLWDKNQKDKFKKLILTDSSQLVAHWKYNFNQWKVFFEIELKKNRKYDLLGFGIFGLILLLLVAFIMYLDSNLVWSVFQYVLLGFVTLMILGYYFVDKYQNKKRRVFLETIEPEVCLSLHGLLINHKWQIAFKKPSVSLIQIDKINLHQTTSLCFIVLYRSSEGDTSKKINIPVPQEEVENLPRVLEAFREDISIKK